MNEHDEKIRHYAMTTGISRIKQDVSNVLKKSLRYKQYKLILKPDVKDKAFRWSVRLMLDRNAKRTNNRWSQRLFLEHSGKKFELGKLVIAGEMPFEVYLDYLKEEGVIE